MLTGKHDYPIAVRLASLVIAALLPIVALTAFLMVRYAQSEQGPTEETVREQVRVLAVDVEREVANATRSAIMLATTSEALRAGDLKTFYREATKAAAIQGLEIILSDATGQQLVNTRAEFGEELPPMRRAAEIAPVLSSGKPHVSGLIYAPRLQRYVISIDVPVADAKGGPYMLSWVITPEIFQRIVDQHLSDGHFAGIVGPGGIVIARSPHPEERVGKRASASFLSQAVSDAGSYNDTALEGFPVFTSYRRLPSTGWLVSVAVPVSVLQAPMLRLMVLIMGCGIGMLALAGGAAYWAGRRVAGPIAALSKSALAIGHAEPPSIPTSGIREISDVGRSLQATYARLQLNESSRKAAEQRLHESRARLEAVMDHAVDGTITIDDRGIVTSFSKPAEHIFGYEAAEVIGRNISMLMPAPYHSARDGYLAAYLATGIAKIIGKGREVKGRRKDGTVFPMDLAVGEIPGQPGGRQFVGTVRDITSRIAAEDQLRQSQKMEGIGQLTGGVAHDFNNLLLAISLSLEDLEAILAGNEAVRPLLAAMNNAAEQARTLTSQLLAFGRRQTLQPTTFDVNEAVLESTAMLRCTLTATIVIETRLGTGLWQAVADRPQLETALLNLAINARDAMPDGGRLVIETQNAVLDDAYASEHGEVVSGEYVLIALTDNGSGIPPEIAARVFEPFFTTKETGRGTGLGLSQVYGYVKQSGGHIALYSELGRGTTVKIYLPRSRDADDRAIEPGRALPNRAGNETVLMVEDNALVRNSVHRMLAGLGYQVLEATDADEALGILRGADEVDLLFSDMVLPGRLGGAEIAAEARRLRPGIRVLLTSGYTSTGVNRSEGAGADLLSKPYTRADLAERLKRLFC